MKQHLLYLFLALLPLLATGQTTISNVDLNIVYVGLENPLTIVAENTPIKKLVITTNNGEIKENETPWHYILIPDHPGDSTIVTVSVKTATGIKTLSKFYYRAVCISGSHVTLLGKTGGRISVNEINHPYGPIARVEGFEIDAYFAITGITVIVYRNGAEFFRKTVKNEKGTRFSDDADVENMMSKLRPYDKLILQDISYEGPAPKICGGYLMPLEFTITE